MAPPQPSRCFLERRLWLDWSAGLVTPVISRLRQIVSASDWENQEEPSAYGATKKFEQTDY
jgi:hypothetical protein